MRLPADVLTVLGAGPGIASVQLVGSQYDLVASELVKLHDHLLSPLGVATPPGTVADAVASYLTARGSWERRLGCQVSRAA